MKKRVAVLVPERTDPAWQLPWRGQFQIISDVFRSRELVVEPRCWTDASDLASFQLVLPLLAWGYHRNLTTWLACLSRWSGQELPIRNQTGLLEWNSSKRYLRDLLLAGVPTVPTLFLESLHPEALVRARAHFEAERLVLKPQVSASAWRTVAWSPGESLDHAPTRDLLVQPYLPSVESEGEISIIILGGDISHSVRKTPAPGDFRVQPEHGGRTAPHVPDRGERSLALRVLDRIDPRPLYARIDIVRRGAVPLVMEVELIEPHLFLDQCCDSRNRFAQAVELVLSTLPEGR